MFTCPSCHHEFDGVVYIDELGTHTVCPECDSSFDVDYPLPTTERTNAGYKIISSIYINDTEEIVMGSMDTRFGTKYVTWQCTNGSAYHWGHYYDSFNAARDDMIRRAAEGSHIAVSKSSAGLSEYIKRILRNDCEFTDKQIESAGKFEAFDAILEAEGIIGYAHWMKELIEDIYGIGLI